MSDQSRRKFLKSTSVGAAAFGAAVIIPSASTADAHPLDSGPAHEGSFTVWVKDAKAGRLVVMAGDSEIVYNDRALAKRLARLAARVER